MPDRKGIQSFCRATVLLLAGFWVGAVFPAQAQTPPAGMKLYVLDCGYRIAFDPARAGLPGLPADKPTSCFLIVHPRGTLLWEDGWNQATYEKPGPDANIRRSLKSQLAEIGYTPDKITYLAVSHYHADHAGNSNDYAGSIWITQRDMREAMFGPWPGVIKAPLPNMNEWNALSASTTIMIANKDYDVFGDGSVVVLYTPSFTPGHQSLLVRLPKTGPVVLSGDLYTDTVQRGILLQMAGRPLAGPPFSQSVIDKFKKNASAEYLATVNRIEDLMAKTKAQLWIQHDPAEYRALKKSPAYYE